MRELPNCKIGLTPTVYNQLRELKSGKDTFNDVVKRLLPESDPLDKFDVVAEAYKTLCNGSGGFCLCGSTECNASTEKLLERK